MRNNNSLCTFTTSNNNLNISTMTHFQIIYKNGNCTLTTENRTHETSAIPSEKMIINCLHSVCLNNGVTNFEHAKAELYCNGGYLTSYRLK